MGTIITKPGGGGAQVGYRGFKYTVTEQFYGAEPNPTDGQAILWFQDDGDGGTYYAGIYIHYKDADGTNMNQIFSTLTSHGSDIQQPYILVNSAGVITLNEIRSASFTAPFTKIVLTNSYGNQNNIGSSGSTCYFHFQTSPKVNYQGYSMAGNLNGTSITVGTSYLGVGSSTAGSTIASRSFKASTPGRRIATGIITTAGVMTGSMSIRVMDGTTPLGLEFVLASGTAAATYQFAYFLALPNSESNLSLRITQSTATSCGINGFSFILL
jgi:hypothetical protein